MGAGWLGKGCRWKRVPVKSDVAFWHLADFRLRAINVRLDSKSGRQIWLHGGLSVEQGFNGLRGA